MYYKYRLQKKQVSTDNGQTWYDVSPLETRLGDVVGTYDTYPDCMSGSPEPSYDTQYLTFDIVSSGTINWKSSGLARTISYSKDSGSTWTSITSTASGTSFNVSAGEKVWFKGNNGCYATDGVTCSLFSDSTAYFNVYGNIMSLISGDTFENATGFTSYYAFNNLFRSTEVINAENLILPVTATNYCYQYMFRDCSNLITAPELPATTLAEGCYRGMFSYCTSLTVAPQLSATALASYCCYNMFAGCTSLTTAPSLPATTMADYCYNYMFSGCTSLTTAPALPATTLANRCYGNMFWDCTSLTTAPELPATTLAQYCYDRMFNGCTSLTTAPELPATTLAEGCYYGMFERCTNLTTAPVLSATTLTDYCYDAMFWHSSSLNYVKCLATDISATKCTDNWLNGVASTGTFVKAASMTDWTTGYNGIPDNWTIQNA